MEKLADKLYSWASILEWNTREQARKASTMPFIYPHLALMPDAHLGKGATVGSVIPTLHAIMPAAVGVDIGCGMEAVRTQFTTESVKQAGKPISQLREAIEEAIPLSAGNYNQQWRGRAETRRRIAELEAMDGADSAEAIAPNWRLQLGSLGSGNHFIEVSRDEQDRVWLFLHSGSRGVGNRLAQKHIRTAQQMCKTRKISLPDPDLAYLDEADGEFWDYITDLRWAQHFALLNRDEMMDRVEACFAEWIGASVERCEVVRCHHNYTVEERICTTCIGIQGSDNQLRERLLADETVARVRDFLVDYHPSVHSCGGLLLTEAGGDPISAPSRADALARAGIAEAAQAAGLVSAHNHLSESDLCVCLLREDTAFDSSSFSSSFGQGFCRPFAAGTDSRTLDRVLAHIFFGEVPRINCTSEHLSEKVWLSRKGAIDASKGVMGLIPGSMGDASYVVEGKGCEMALNSSPHGAGRNFSRSQAKKTFTMEQLEESMAGIEWRHSSAFLDEISGAYKPVEQVMQDAADLVEVRHTLRQFVNVKGD